MHYVAKVIQDTWWTQDTHELAKTEVTVAVGAAGGITIKNVPNLTLDGASILDIGEGEGPSFVCGDGEEVPFDWVNDGYENCSDGSDEQQYDSDARALFNSGFTSQGIHIIQIFHMVSLGHTNSVFYCKIIEIPFVQT